MLWYCSTGSFLPYLKKAIEANLSQYKKVKAWIKLNFWKVESSTGRPDESKMSSIEPVWQHEVDIYQFGKDHKVFSKALGLQWTTVRTIIHKWRTQETNGEHSQKWLALNIWQLKSAKKYLDDQQIYWDIFCGWTRQQWKLLENAKHVGGSVTVQTRRWNNEFSSLPHSFRNDKRKWYSQSFKSNGDAMGRL